MREFFAIWIAVYTWGDSWVNRQVVIHTDSTPARDIWVKGSCPDKDVMRIVRAMFMFAAKRNINIMLQHVHGAPTVFPRIVVHALIYETTLFFKVKNLLRI